MEIHDGSFGVDDYTEHAGEQVELAGGGLAHDSLTYGSDGATSTDPANSGDSGIGTTDGSPADSTTGSGATISLDVNGDHYTAPESMDLNNDGTPDAGVIEEGTDQVLIVDTNGDHQADTAVVFKDGEVIGAAERGSDGQWHQTVGGSTSDTTGSTDTGGTGASSTGTDGTGTDTTGGDTTGADGTGSDTTGTGSDTTGTGSDTTGTGGDTTGTGGDTTGTGGSGAAVTPVPNPGRLAIDVNGTNYEAPAQYDSNGDGTPDTAVVTESGLTYVFVDVNGDGEADRAAAYTADGHIEATATRTNGSDWTDDAAVNPAFPSTLPSNAEGTPLDELPSSPDSSGSDSSGSGGYVVDPQTGQWVHN